MECQMPGCRNKVNKYTNKEGIFLGIHLENVVIFTCSNHSSHEIESELEKIGEEEASALTIECNSFDIAQKMIKKA